MTTEANKAIVQRYFDEILNRADYDNINNYLHSDFHGSASEKINRYSHMDFFKKYRLSFPDMHIETKRMIAEGNSVAVLSTWSGTFTGADFQGNRASGKQFSYDVIAIYDIQGGKIISGQVVGNQLIPYRQLGITPLSSA